MQSNDPILYGATFPYKDFAWQQPHLMGSAVTPWQSAPRMIPPLGTPSFQQPWAPHTPHMQQQYTPYMQQPWNPYLQHYLPAYLQQPWTPFMQQQYTPYPQQPVTPYLQQPVTPYLQQPSVPFVQSLTQPVTQPFFNWQRPFAC